MSTVEKKDEEVEQLLPETPSSNDIDLVFNKELFDTNAISILGSVFNTACQDNFDTVGCTKSASVKFMITIQDEADLKALGYERVIGQTLYYQSMIKTQFKQDKVRAIIIAREISSELKAATQYLSDFELFEYQLSLTLAKVN